MHYIPAKFKDIDEAQSFIEDRDEFVVSDKGDYIVIDYVFNVPDSFDVPERREFRGLKFYSNGELAARPLHKFFNLNEKPSTQIEKINFNNNHVVMDKMDGSMIHPCLINNNVVFMTRMGITNVAEEAYSHASEKVINLSNDLLRQGFTPIFEYTGPDNRIVILYDKPDITLLAIRGTITGEYMIPERVESLAKKYGVPYVGHTKAGVNNVSEFVSMVRSLKGKEGYVIRFYDGEMYKIKAEDYLLKHRSKDMTRQDKDLIALMISGGIDDIIPMLDDNDRDKVIEFVEDINDLIKRNADLVLDNVENALYTCKDKKDYAINHVKKLNKFLHGVAFRAFENKSNHAEIYQMISDQLMKNTSSGPKVNVAIEALRDVR